MTVLGRFLLLVYGPPSAVLALYALAFLEHGWGVVSFPYQIDYGEAPELNRAVLISQGLPVYVDWSRPPYQMANYTPLYPAVASIGVMFRGADFFFGRLVSFLSTLAAAGLIGGIAWSLGAGWRGAAIGGLLYLAAHPVWNWGAFQRVDAMAVALELAGMALFTYGWVRQRLAWGVWVSVLVFVLAAYTRQTVVAGAVACYGYLLWRSPRLAFGAIGAYAGLGLGVFGVFQIVTGGQFWRHIGDGNLNRWSWDIFFHYWGPFWRLQHWAFGLVGVGIVASMVGRRAQIPLLYLAASAATALTMGKVGSNVNYLLQLCAALALGVGIVTGEVSRVAGRLPRLLSPVPHVLLSVWVLVGLQQLYHVPHGPGDASRRQSSVTGVMEGVRFIDWPLWRLDPLGTPPAALGERFRAIYLGEQSAADLEHARRAHTHVAGMAGEVLSEDMTFTVTAGRRIYLQPFEFSQLAEQGDWDQMQLLEDVRQRRFGVVVLRFRLGDEPTWHGERINAPLRQALEAGYRLEANYGDYFVYRPHEPGLWNHIANILLPTYRRVGIGVVVSASGVQYLAENFAD